MTFWKRIAILALLICPTVVPAAVGDLTVSPTRVIFEGRDRSTQINLINRGEEAATYRIEFLQYRMQEDGQLVEVQEPNELEKFADKLVRFSPRQVKLEPNQAQTVRLLLRKPKDLPAGEYRSHLLFFAVPDEQSGADIERRASTDEEGFSIAITPIFRISIPVIVRHGELAANFNISDVALDNSSSPQLSLMVQRDGNRSVYGDLRVNYYSSQSAEPVLLNYAKDFVLYTSTNTRKTSLDLRVPDGVNLNDGELKINYSTKEEGIEGELASFSLPLH
jgi:P pilus assembly chaperone PapD